MTIILIAVCAGAAVAAVVAVTCALGGKYARFAFAHRWIARTCVLYLAPADPEEGK